jgi:hypothetical protein
MRFIKKHKNSMVKYTDIHNHNAQKKYLKRILNPFHRGGPGSNPGLVMWDFVMDKSGTGAGFL